MRKFALALVFLAVLATVAYSGDITANGMFQGDLFTFLSNVVTMSNETKADSNVLRTNSIAPQCFTSAKMAASTTTSISLVGNMNYMISGVMYYKAAAVVLASATQQTEDTQCRYLISLNTSGTATTTKGVEVVDITSAAADTTVTPATPADHCPIGYIHVIASEAFTLAVTSLNASCTYVNLSTNNTAPTAITTTDLTLSDL